MSEEIEQEIVDRIYSEINERIDKIADSYVKNINKIIDSNIENKIYDMVRDVMTVSECDVWMSQVIKKWVFEYVDKKLYSEDFMKYISESIGKKLDSTFDLKLIVTSRKNKEYE